jgi:signal transduction histidine kinase/ActR/RegA family two-component response regulator
MPPERLHSCLGVIVSGWNLWSNMEQPESFNFIIPAAFLWEAKLVSLLSVWMLVAFFYYLNRHTKREYFTIWTATWLFYALWLTLNLEVPKAQPGEALYLFEQWCLAFSAVFLLWGSLRFLNLSGRQMLFGLFMLFLVVWAWVSPYVFGTNRLAIELPEFILIGLCSAFAGLCFFRLRMRMPFIGAGLLSVGFQLWALYLASYPVARLNKDFFAADFYIGAVLQVFMAASMIVLVLEEVRLNANQMQAEIAEARSEKEAALAKVLSSEEQCRNLYNQVRLSEGVQKAYDELRRTQDGLAQKERLAALGQMASGIAHDINNALSPILGYSDMLLTQMPGIPVEAKKYLQIINQSSDDIARILARMREFYRRRSDPAGLTEMNVNKTIQDVVEMTRPRWRDIPLREGIEINVECSLEPDLPVLYGDPEEIREGMFNLIFNAVDALSGGGKITITTKFVEVPDAPSAAKYGKQQVAIEVSDNGAGMDEATKKRCLEPFFSTKSANGGTGLGLPMVYGMMQRHEGIIQIESTKGVGTTVRLTFPVRIPKVQEAPAIPTPKPKEKRSVKVLCIDDESPVRQLLDDCLTQFGHRVAVAASGKEGLELFRTANVNKQPYEVVITDMGMPDVDGYQVAEAISSESRNTPIIMMTGWGTMMREEKTTPAAVNALIDKPPHMQELNDLLLKLTEKKNGAEALG